MKSKVSEICSKKDYVTEKRYLEIIKPCMDLAISRNKKYGSSIEEMDDTSIIDLIKMKLVRTKNMLREQEDSEGEFDEKVYDELFDSINFLVYICMRMKEYGKELKATQGRHNQ